MKTRKTTEKDIEKFFRVTPFLKADNESELDYKDRFVTKEQRTRDHYITELLNQYVSFYKSKVTHGKVCRYVILLPYMAIVIAFSVLLVVLSWRVLSTDSELQIQEVVAFVTACISFISLIIGLLTIITKYFFPENDEQYITTIVEAIQKNDLENKRENARHTPDSTENASEED